MAEEKVFKFSSLNQTFSPSFAKIESKGDTSAGLPDSCKVVNVNGRIVCGRQIEPIDDEFILSLFGKKKN